MPPIPLGGSFFSSGRSVTVTSVLSVRAASGFRHTIDMPWLVVFHDLFCFFSFLAGLFSFSLKFFWITES